MTGQTSVGGRPLTYRDVAPNFRHTVRQGRTYVEIPARHELSMWPPANPDNHEMFAIHEKAKALVAGMVAAHRKTMVYDEGSVNLTGHAR